MTVDLDALEAVLAKMSKGPLERRQLDIGDLNPVDIDAILALIDAAPELIAEIRELRAKLQAAAVEADGMRVDYDVLQEKLDSATIRNTALRAALLQACDELQHVHWRFPEENNQVIEWRSLAGMPTEEETR